MCFSYLTVTLLYILSGPMVWYQQFEYAVGHWLQKAAEHVFGCVLCCPGCFSLFRGSALMDDNVMKMYTTKPTEARHYIQFEQGEQTALLRTHALMLLVFLPLMTKCSLCFELTFGNKLVL